jgi:hypothetical protein
MEHLDENLQYATDDLNAFKAIELLNNEKQSIEEINTYTEIDTPIDLIKEKIEQVRVMATEYNLFVSHTSKAIAEWRIRLGAAFNELRFLVRMSDESWEQWADENLPFVGKRNRQKCMLLARRVDCHRHTDLGVDRLEMLCSATKDSDAENPIGAFMSRHGIAVDETADVDLEGFKLQVDTALNREKLERRHIQVSPEVVETATREGKSFDKGFLKRLSNIQRDGGDPEAYLRDPSSVRQEKEESEPTVEDRVKEFKTLANKMIRTVDDILTCPDQISKIEPDSINELIEKLMELQTAASINTEEAEAA